jgi:hypothetical protein
MKHNSLADFTNKVTSKDLLKITIIRITCVKLFGKVTGTSFPFVSVLKVAKSQKVLDTACKIEKIRENKNGGRGWGYMEGEHTVYSNNTLCI